MWSYGAAAHLLGDYRSVVMFPVVRSGVVGPRTNRLKGHVTEAWSNWLVRPASMIQVSIDATQSRHSRALSAVMLTGLLVVVSALAYSHGQDAYNYYYELYFK